MDLEDVAKYVILEDAKCYSYNESEVNWPVHHGSWDTPHILIEPELTSEIAALRFVEAESVETSTECKRE